MQAYANQFYTDFGRTLDSTFTDPRVRTRYDQLNRQYMGFSAFNNPQFQRQLNLTPQQTAQIRQLAAVWRQQLQQMRGQNSTNANINAQQWNTMYNQYWDQLNRVLTPEQQQTWTQLTGQRYTFAPNLYMNNDSGGNIDGQFSDGTTPVNPSGQTTGPNSFLKQPGGQGGQNPSNATPQTPQGGTASGTQGATVR
jgi:hypothetical protein